MKLSMNLTTTAKWSWEDTNNKIRQMYAIGLGQLARIDIGLMKHPLRHQLDLPLHTKRQWLESIAAAIHRKKLHKHGAMMTAEQRLMETWVIQNHMQPAPVTVSECRQ